jgi:hypothetical protein
LKTSSLVAALAFAVLAGCTTSTGPSASTPRAGSPSPVAFNPAESKAADFRTRLDLLLGEHVIAVAKESSAAGRDEYASYLRLLTSNGTDLTELVRSALGDNAATSFNQIWSTQNDNLVNYTIGLVTHNKSKADGAMLNLVRRFVPQFSQFMATAAAVPLDPITQLTTQHLFETKAMIDDQFATSYTRSYADLRIVYAQASRIGDALAPKIAERFPDKFPGNPSTKAVDVRVSMNNLLQEHAYLATMATSAALGDRAAEQAAATRALGDNAGELGTLFGSLFGQLVATRFSQVWASKDAATLAYVASSTGAAKQTALGQLSDVFVTQFSGFVQDSSGLASSVIRPALQSQVEAMITVLDEQRSKSSANLGPDDRAANASMQPVADLIAIAAVARLQLA